MRIEYKGNSIEIDDALAGMFKGIAALQALFSQADYTERLDFGVLGELKSASIVDTTAGRVHEVNGEPATADELAAATDAANKLHEASDKEPTRHATAADVRALWEAIDELRTLTPDPFAPYEPTPAQEAASLRHQAMCLAIQGVEGFSPLGLVERAKAIEAYLKGDANDAA